MKIAFHGACRTVTGSLHELQIGGRRIVLDCGLFQGPRQLARQTNEHFDFDPKSVEFVVLSHGHMDHCGNLPNLVKQGFKGRIYCTKATAALTALMLMDSAKIQEEDAGYLNQKTVKSWQGQIQPLYTRDDAEKTIGLFASLEYGAPRDFGGFTVEMREAGHVLGSAAIRIVEQAGGKSLVFTGDVGRPNSPILNDPIPYPQADAVISECTYGGRTHAPVAEVPNQLALIIQETIARGGILMIPAFALGRTQTMVQQIHQLRDARKIPSNIPVFVDSPLATRLTEVFRRFENLWDAETRAMFEPFDEPNLTYTPTVADSMKLNQRPGPMIIIASSGMCEGGRILHHLKHHIREPRNTVLLAGFQGAGTLGRKIGDRMPEVPILGDIIPLRCQVEKIDGLSAHADGEELVAYTKPLKGAKVYLVHGEIDAAQAHQKALEAAGFTGVTIADRGQVVEV
jgi:metallo-beta-lactamase family protein